MHPTRTVMGLIRLGDSEFVLGDPEDELSELRAEGVLESSLGLDPTPRNLNPTTGSAGSGVAHPE